MKRIIAAAMVVLFAGVGQMALAGTGTWTSIGPYGGQVHDLAVDYTNSIIYTNAGDQTSNGSIFQSTDAGKTWSLYYSGTAGSGYALYANQSVKGKVTALGIDLYQYSKSGGYRSLDFLDNQRALAVSPDGQTIYVGSYSAGIAASTDGGGSFANRSNGLPAASGSSGYAEILSIAVDPNTPSTAYALVDGLGIYETTDSGNTWSAFDNGLPGTINSGTIYVDPYLSNTVFFGNGNSIYKSVGGSAWSAVTAPSVNDIASFAADPAASTDIFAVNQTGSVYKSTDSGDSWSSTGIAIAGATPAHAIAVVHDTGRALLVAGDTGIWRSTDDGGSWVAADDGLSGPTVNSIAQSPSDPARYLIGTEHDGVMLTTDGGSSYSLGKNTSYLRADGIIWSPSDANTAYAAVFGSISKTTDGGVTWVWTNVYANSAVAVDPKNPDYLLGASSYHGVSLSTDGGVTTGTSNQGDMGSTYDVRALLMDPRDPSKMYAGTWSHGLLTSSDEGVTWHAIGPSGISVTSMAINPANPDEILVGTFGSGFYESDDAGATWTDLKIEVNNNIDPWVTGIAFDSNRPDVVYVASDIGIGRSVDGGKTWQTMPDVGQPFGGLGVAESVAIDSADSSHILVGYQHGGVYEYTAGVDLAVAGTVPVSQAVGQAGTLKFAITNQSVELTSADVEATVTVDPNLTIGSITPGSGACTSDKNVISCDFGPLAPTSVATLDVSVSAASAGSYDSVLTASSYEHELNEKDNSATLSTNVVASTASGGSSSSSSNGGSSGGGGAFGFWILLGLSGLALRCRN